MEEGEGRSEAPRRPARKLLGPAPAPLVWLLLLVVTG